MIKRLKLAQYGMTALLFTLASLAATITLAPQASALSGAGTEASPWQITNCADLQELNTSASYRDDSFVLVNDVDCQEVDFTRIMFLDSLSFTGTFDGAGHTIRNVAVNNSTGNHNGLFGHLEGATVRDLTLQNITVSAEETVGVLAGLVEDSTIENITVDGGAVTSRGEVYHGFGGLMGDVRMGTRVFNVIVDVAVTAPDARGVGGLAGRVSESSELGQVAALGAVEGREDVGGLVGTLNNSSLDKAFATGSVVAHDGTGGGLVGIAYESTLIGTYARGSVTGSGYVGGHTGYVDASTTVGWAYATGAITPLGEAVGGGLAGYVDADATIQADSFWDVQTTGMATSGGSNEVGKTTAEMKDMNTYVPHGWNFDDYWFQGDEVNDGYLCQIWYQVCYDAFMASQPEDTSAVRTITTGAATNITPTGARIHGTAQLGNGKTINDMIFNGGSLMLGFHFNTSPTVDWDNYTHTAPVLTVAPINGDDTHLSFYADYNELECNTQYWFIAAYDTLEGEGSMGIADATGTFKTAACDDDNDGVANDIEAAAPNNGDANGDGIADAEQKNVASLVSPVSQKYVTLEVDESCALSNVSIANASSHAVRDDAYDYQSGFVNFTATGCDEGVANVKLYYHGVSPDGLVARKYNPVTNTYFTIASAAITAAPAPLNAAVASYTITDNGELDIDPADGVIVDPVGLAAIAPGVPNTGLALQGAVAPIVAVLAALVLLGGVVTALYRKRTHFGRF